MNGNILFFKKTRQDRDNGKSWLENNNLQQNNLSLNRVY